MNQSELSFTTEADPQLDGQCARLLAYLKRRGKITNLQAITELSILNGKGRVHDLRQAGYCIETKWVRGVNRYGEKYRCAEYVLHEARDSQLSIS
jgi:hypothetical protein